VNYGSNLALFANHVWQIAFERPELVEGFVCPPEGVAYELHAMRLCMALGGRMLEKRLNLAIMSGGDWRGHTRIAIPVPVGSQLNSINIRMAVADAAQNTLAGGLYHVVARHHFTEFDTAYSSYIMLDGVYGIRRGAWRRFAEGFVHPPMGSRHKIKGPKGKGCGGRQPPGVV
jgi:hypothetical protein